MLNSPHKGNILMFSVHLDMLCASFLLSAEMKQPSRHFRNIPCVETPFLSGCQLAKDWFTSPSTSLPCSQLVPNLLPRRTFLSPLCIFESGSGHAVFVSPATYFSSKAGGLSIFSIPLSPLCLAMWLYFPHQDVSFIPFAVRVYSLRKPAISCKTICCNTK